MTVWAAWLDAGATAVHLATFAGAGQWRPLCPHLGTIGFDDQHPYPMRREEPDPYAPRGGGRLAHLEPLRDAPVALPVCLTCVSRWRALVGEVDAALSARRP